MTRSGWSVPGYAEVRELGRGASGVVVLARHEQSGTPVAIKFLSEDLAGDPEFLEDFRAEARILGELSDAHVVRLWEYVETASGAAIVMDLVDGVTLRRMLDDRGATSPESALVVLRGSLLGLGAAHRAGIVHRDYKPENVMVTREGDSRLTDFGIAAHRGASTLVAGTPRYMAPERWDDGPATVRSDVYAATAGFVECLIGAPPYRAPTAELLRRQHEHAPLPLGEVPAPVRDLVARGLAKDPADRPAHAEDLLVELEAAASAGYGEDWEERGRRGLAERAALLALLFPLAAGVVGGSAIATTVLGGETPPAAGRGFSDVLSRRAKIGAGLALAAVLATGPLVIMSLGDADPSGRAVIADAGRDRSLPDVGGSGPAVGPPIVLGAPRIGGAGIGTSVDGGSGSGSGSGSQGGGLAASSGLPGTGTGAFLTALGLGGGGGGGGGGLPAEIITDGGGSSGGGGSGGGTTPPTGTSVVLPPTSVTPSGTTSTTTVPPTTSATTTTSAPPASSSTTTTSDVPLTTSDLPQTTSDVPPSSSVPPSSPATPTFSQPA